MSVFNFALDVTVEDRLFGALQRDGLTCLENVVDPDYLRRCQQRVDEVLKERGERYFSIIQPWKSEQPAPFDQIATDQSFLALLRNLSRRGHSEEAARQSELYNVLRIIAGDKAGDPAFEFHYDAVVVTALMPLFIPEDAPGHASDLVAWPNRRPHRRFALFNVLEKALLQNSLAYRVYRRRYGSGKHNVIKLKPGNLYFFWGYRTFHGNLPATPRQKRATLLFHFGNPHPHSILTRMVLPLRRLREQIRLRAR